MKQDPTFSLITIDDAMTIRLAMQQLGLWDSGETITSVERAGEGNMNVVLRVATNRRRVILKQSRPWVEKYPQIAAPADRVFAEIDFYHRVSEHDEVSAVMPELLASSSELYLMAIEDLGRASDYSDLYSIRNVDSIPLHEATTWIAQLHAITIDAIHQDEVGNHALRELNHAHIFVIPLQAPSAIDLDRICDGLEQLASAVRRDVRIHDAAQRLGDVYLGSGPHLLHGDFYPGSWLRTSQGLRVIDPEFCFAGPAEFDLAVLSAHRVLIGGAGDSVDVVAKSYMRSRRTSVDMELLRGFVAMEIIRRLIGVAQLPLNADIRERERMIQIAISMLAT